MAAGLNHMVARQSKISFSRGSSRPRDRTQVSDIAGRCFNLGSTREAIKYKNTVSQKTSYRDTELQIQVLTSKISREEKKPGWKKKGGGGRGVRKGWSYRHLLPPTDTQALWDFSLGFQRREDWNSALPEPEFEFSAKRRWSVSNPQLRLRALRPDSCIQDRGTRKTEKDRKG